MLESMSDVEDSQYSDLAAGWISWFCALEDHQFLCEIDEDFIRDNFNLYGIKQRFNHYKYVHSCFIYSLTLSY